jgi:hypothetical protein
MCRGGDGCWEGLGLTMDSQFDSIPVNITAAAREQVTERPRRFGDRPPR